MAQKNCLNPCYNGIDLIIIINIVLWKKVYCLNPCYNGIDLISFLIRRGGWLKYVLILVIME